MTPTTYWIARDLDDRLLVFDRQPRPGALWFYGDSEVANIDAAQWRFAGLPHEPAPGECWEVRWVELYVTALGIRFVPIARNVTAELKEKADG